MTTKEKLLTLLQGRKGNFVSGEEIAKELQVSRTAIWKAVNTLRQEGYEIQAVQNKGYSLSVKSDILSEQGIRTYLSSNCQDLQLDVQQTVTSTNAVLRGMASDGASEGTVVIAQMQTEGRGRLGRKFYSPVDSGIYMSVLLRPRKLLPNQAMRITTMAAVAAAEAIETVSGKPAQIKWVNDIYMRGKKVSGILSEAAFDMESGRFEYVILGIGINVYEPKDGFPEEISGIAGSIFESQDEDRKNKIAALFLSRFFEIYQSEDTAGYAEAYRSRSFVIGKPVRIHFPTEEKEATALDVDRDCHLVVRYQDGTVETLSSAEISVRMI